MKKWTTFCCCALFGSLTGCQSLPPIKTSAVDLDRFMGKWYVIAAIPTFIEDQAFKPTETYEKNKDGSIATTFQFHYGSVTGPIKTYHPTGYVVPETGNAEWGMQFIWPIKSEYLIAYVSEDYTQTIIARNKRDHVWIMARTPLLDDASYASLVARVTEMGYATDKLVKFPQQALD